MIMEFKQGTIGDILNSEHEMVLHGAENYGDYFNNALDFNDLLQNCIKSIDPDRYIFAAFLSQVRKHLTLALYSIVRRHHVQAMMDTRQALEAGTCAAYAIAHPGLAEFADIDADGLVEVPQALTIKRYKWLKEKFKVGSDAIKKVKDNINIAAAHSNIVYAQKNFKLDGVNGKFVTPFFDVEDQFHIKSYLWQNGNIAMLLMDLFYGVNKSLNVVKFTDDFIVCLKALEAKNHHLKAEIMNTDRFKEAQKLVIKPV